MNHADRKTIGHRVRAIREGLGWNQNQMAGRLSVSTGMISHYETGRHLIPINVAVRLVKLGKTTLAHLYGVKERAR